jgi:oxalate decarboxylase
MITRRSILGASSSIAAALLSATVAGAQQRNSQSASDAGPENQALLKENPSSNVPPRTDSGDVGPIWYSFDLTHKRIQEGGWTHQVTQRELPSSKDLAGVNMRLTAGSFRELHWHTADEWAIMLTGNARVSVLNPDGTIFLDDVSKGDLLVFPRWISAFHSRPRLGRLRISACVRSGYVFGRRHVLIVGMDRSHAGCNSD